MKTLVVANWKMNPSTLGDAKRLFDSINRGLKNNRDIEVVICPPFVYLSNIQCLKSNIKIGAQDCFWEKKGAFTGAISPTMLKDLNCGYALIGHSERREYFNVSDEQINKKIKAVIKEGITPILCVGETSREKEEGKAQQVLTSQLRLALEKVPSSKFQASRLCVAYEPIWAIGSGKHCSNDEAMTMGILVRKIIAQIYSRSLAQKTRVLYGGSVNSENGDGYIKEAKMDGLLIGGASLRALEFIKIVKAVSAH